MADGVRGRVLVLIVRVGRATAWAVLIASFVLAAFIPLLRRREDLPWTPLRSLNDPVGAFTAEKLARLEQDPAACRSLLTRGGFPVRVLPAIQGAPACRVAAPLRLDTQPPDPAFKPAGLPLSCPLAAALALWMRAVVEPAARSTYGSRIASIETYGSYSCRRINGGASGDWSEHARANAIDVAGFRLADGHRVTVAADWRGRGRDAAFLHLVRDGGCRIFSTVLSPDYNAAHHDHLHLDEAARGQWGWQACR